MEDGMWLDLFLYNVMKRFNVVLGGYVVMDKKAGTVRTAIDGSKPQEETGNAGEEVKNGNGERPELTHA